MKKSYFVTWVGAISTFFITLLATFRKIKKYGQKMYSKPKTNFIKILELANKGLDIVLEKFIYKEK